MAGVADSVCGFDGWHSNRRRSRSQCISCQNIDVEAVASTAAVWQDLRNSQTTQHIAPDWAAARGAVMSVYRAIDVIGTSTDSWEDAAAVAVRTASQSVRDLRVAEVVEQDIHLDEGGAITYRTKLRISFKYESPQ
jgi:flavin-binding protein dodecin